MTQTIFNTATSLDGFLADEQNSLAWLLKQDFDWSGPLNPSEFMTDVGAVCMGSTTYEWLLKELGATEDSWPYTMPAWVLTHRELPSIPGADIRFASGEISPIHAEMTSAAEGKNIWVVGGGDVAAQFATAGLLDQILVAIAPVTLGSGQPLFTRAFDLRLNRLERNRGFACLWYDILNPLSSGTSSTRAL